MKHLKSIKKRLFLMLLLTVLGATSMDAQVSIGKNVVPHAGAILDLSRNERDLGLLLPHVALDDVSVLQVVPGANDAQKAIAKGMVVYNTFDSTVGGNGTGLYVWDGAKWRSLALDGGAMTISPAVVPPVSAAGGTTGTITVSSPGAKGYTGDYTFVIIAGREYAEVNPSTSSDGKFSVTFQPNNTAVSRKAVVLVTDPAGNMATFVFSQDANSEVCMNSGSDNPVVTQTGTLGTNGAVYFNITAEPGVNYVWTHNGIPVFTGINYIATQPGNYVVYGGAVGCPHKTSRTLPVPVNPSPDPVLRIVSSNGGVVCGSDPVTLTASGVSDGTWLQWFRDGVPLPGKTAASIQVAEAGAYFVAVTDGTYYSHPSNTLSVTVGGGSSQVSLNPDDVKVNGSPIRNFDKFCKGSSLYLTVDNRQAGVNYIWYNGNDVITSTNPYVVPATRNAILLRLVAIDRSGALCPAETNSTEKIIVATAPAVASISGNNQLCSGQGISLTASGADNAVSYEWYRDGFLDQTTTVNNIIVRLSGSYKVRYSQSGACMSDLSAAFDVNVQGAPAIEWGRSVTEVNPAAVYTFSVRPSDGSSPPTAYSWTAIANGISIASVNGRPGSDLSGITGNTVDLKFSGNGGNIGLIVTPINACGKGSPIIERVSMPDQVLAAPIVTPNSGIYCGGVNFKIDKPSSWTSGQWSAFSQSNITSVTLGGRATSGVFTSDGTSYYYFIRANSSSAQAARITVGGFIGAVAVTSATVQVQLQTSTESSFAVDGTKCFDINRSNVTGRTKADFDRTYTYSLSGTLGSNASISNVVWTYKNRNNAVRVFTPASGSSTITRNQVVVKYNPALLNDATITASGIQIVITATITTTGGSCSNAIYTAEIPVIIKDASCCEGAIISKGAYNNVNSYYTDMVGSFSTNWTGINRFTAKNKDLCWNKTDVTPGRVMTWANAGPSCTGGWRLPNLREMHELYRALGGIGHSAMNFGNLQSPNSNPGGADNMASYFYWTDNESSSAGAYIFYFGNGGKSINYKVLNNYVRCVREL